MEANPPNLLNYIIIRVIKRNSSSYFLLSLIFLVQKKKDLLKSESLSLYINYCIQFYLKKLIIMPPYCEITGANTNETIVISFIRIFIEGPEVSLNGSPTVSPTTPAL